MVQQAFFADALRGALLLGGVLLAMRLLRRAAASTRRLVLALGLAGTLALPALSAALPAWRLPAPSLALPVPGKLVAEPPAVPGGELAPAPAPSPTASPGVSATRSVDPSALIVYVWALGALLLVAR